MSLAQEMLYQDAVVVVSLSEMVVSAVTIRAGHLHLLQIQILSEAAAAWLGLLYFGSLPRAPSGNGLPWESIFEWSQGWI